MIHFQLYEDEGILVVTPSGPLKAEDFALLARSADRYIEEHGRLRGLMIYTDSFPGWSDFGALISHLRFVRDHHRSIARVAAVTDNGFLAVAQAVAAHFAGAEILHFDYDDKEAALAWLRRS
jgi:hypothetical protein